MNNSIETERILLRSLREEDIEPLFNIQNNPTTMRYTIYTNTIEETSQRLQKYAKEEKEIGFAPWTVISKVENKVIGWGGLNIDPYDPGWGVEVIYFFHQQYWGKGYATELVNISINEGFNTHNIQEINAFAHRENIGSIRVLLKNGFNFVRFEEKLNRNHYIISTNNSKSPNPRVEPT
jgi:ribosomal-protein-alanine N-acetyltransferase